MRIPIVPICSDRAPDYGDDMTRYAAFLRAVNVGGTGKLPMAELRAMCDALGFADVKTYIASGNVALSDPGTADEVKAKLEARLADYAGKPVPVMVRTAAELAEILASNPFGDYPGNQVMAVLFDDPPEPEMIREPKGQADEELALGMREIFAYFPQGMGQSKLQLPGAKIGTARNMNTIAKMAAMIAD